MLKNLIKNRKESGFTIIEVMIVLAIAGLILVVVLIAVPQLQRNQRNEARRSVASRIVTEINNYAGNNNGNFPVASTSSGQTNFASATAAAGFFDRYLGCSTSGAGAGASTSCTTNIDDPRTGQPVGTGQDGGATITTTASTTSSTALGTTPGSIHYATSVVCNGEVHQAGSNRNFAFQMRLEGGAIYCIDNK